MLTKEQIVKWHTDYNNDPKNDNVRTKAILDKIDKTKTWKDFKELLTGTDGILKWKGALRTKNYYKCLGETKWTDFLTLAKQSALNPKETVKKIVDFAKKNMWYEGKGGLRRGGISYPVASTIVFFFSKQECPIIDWRAVSTLKNNGYNNRLNNINLHHYKKKDIYQIKLEDDGWSDYYVLCHEIVSNLKIAPEGNDTSIRVLDKALWYPAR